MYIPAYLHQSNLCYVHCWERDSLALAPPPLLLPSLGQPSSALSPYLFFSLPWRCRSGWEGPILVSISAFCFIQAAANLLPHAGERGHEANKAHGQVNGHEIKDKYNTVVS